MAQVMLAAVAMLCALPIESMTAAANSSDFTVAPTAGAAPLAVRFTIGRPGRFKIDFGDGSSPGSVDTILSQPWHNHVYMRPANRERRERRRNPDP